MGEKTVTDSPEMPITKPAVIRLAPFCNACRKWRTLWASLRHMQSMQVHCPTHNEQYVTSHNSKSTGTELTGQSRHVSHTYIAQHTMHSAGGGCIQRWLKRSQMTCHEYMYKSLLCCSCFYCRPSPTILPLSKLH